MALLRIALVQACAEPRAPEANLERCEALCRQARALGADVALLPEMFSHGYSFPSPEDAADVDRWNASAIGPDDPYLTRLRDLARELGMAIAATYLERWRPAPRNTVCLIDREGVPRLTYAKVHTCDFSAERLLTPGSGFPVRDLPTEGGPVRVGAMICYDREFPESCRLLMLEGAEIVLAPNACEMEAHRMGQLAARAYENMVGIALTNYPAPHANGHSVAFDGAAFALDGRSRDMRLVEAGEGEGIHLATFDLDALRDYRARECWADTYRHPALYGGLVASPVRDPFVRADARRDPPSGGPPGGAGSE